MKTYVKAVVAVLLIAGGTYLLFLRPVSTSSIQEDSLSYRTYVNQQLGIEFEIPTDWIVKENSNAAFIISSPDFETYAGSTTIRGASFILQMPQEVDPSLRDPNTYRTFVLSNKWSDGSVPQEIKLGGEVAFLQKTFLGCGMGCDDPDIPMFSLETIHKGKRYQFSFDYDELSPGKQKILDTLIQSFQFLN